MNLLNEISGGYFNLFSFNGNFFNFIYSSNKIQFISYFKNKTTSMNASINFEMLDFFKSNNTSTRFNTYSHPNVLYKIKIGNYMPDDNVKYNYVNQLNSLNFKTTIGLSSF